LDTWGVGNSQEKLEELIPASSHVHHLLPLVMVAEEKQKIASCLLRGKTLREKRQHLQKATTLAMCCLHALYYYWRAMCLSGFSLFAWPAKPQALQKRRLHWI